jgi:hypothetical protein
MAASLILRTVKGTPLTNLEVDNNFSNLNTFGDVVSSNVGSLSSLTTTAKGNIVVAVNELNTVLSTKTGTGNVVYSVGPTVYLPVINNTKIGYTTTATAGGTTTLDVNSTYYQTFTGTSNQTIQLPVTSTLAVGMSYHIENNGTGTLTINSSGSNAVGTVGPFQTVLVTCILASGTDAASWDYDIHGFNYTTGTGNVVLSGSPTFTGTLTSPAITSTTTLTTKKIVETVVAIGNTGTAVNIDLSLGTVFTATLNGNATMTITNPGAVSSFVLILTNDGTAGRSVAFAGGSFKYAGGAATLARTTTANAVDFWFFMTPDGGTTWYGSQPIKDAKA